MSTKLLEKTLDFLQYFDKWETFLIKGDLKETSFDQKVS